MIWKEIKISDKDSLIHELSSYGPEWLFRGHALSEWGLQSTLERLFNPLGWEPESAEKCEEASLHIFSSKAHHYLDYNYLPKTKLGWLSLMQHHGIPTRLLDFTESPFMALFFSLGDLSKTGQFAAIWAINYRNLTKHSIDRLKGTGFDYDYSSAQMNPDAAYDRILESGAHDLLWTTEPKISNLRLERQKGSFLLSCNIRKRISDLLPVSLRPEDIHKIIFSRSLVHDFYRLLKGMGIDNRILYADLDGLAKDIRNELIYQTVNSASRTSD